MPKKDYYNSIQASNYVTDKDLAITTFIKYQLDRTQSMFTYDGLDDSIPEHMVELMLQKNGTVFITKEDGNLYAFTGGEGGEPDVYGRPTIYTVANPALKISKNYVIDKDGILIKNDTYEVGLLPMLNKYGSLIVENDISIRTIIIYLRIVGVISASDDISKSSADVFIKKIVDGELSVIGDNAFFDGVKVQSLGNNTSSYIQQFIELEQYLKGSLFNELGLNANYNMKRETLTKNETTLNQDFLMPFCDDMLACRKDGWDKVNEMFGTDIKVEYSSTWKKREITDAISMQQANVDDSSQLEESAELNEDGQIEEEIDGVIDETIEDNISDTSEDVQSDNTEEVDANESEESTDKSDEETDEKSDEDSESENDDEQKSEDETDEQEESLDDKESNDSSQLEDEQESDKSEDESEKSEEDSEETKDDSEDEEDDEKKKKKGGCYL